MTVWMLHSLLVSTPLMAAAHAAEGSLRLYRVPARWTWVAALAFSLALPLIPAPRSTPPLALWSLPELASGIGAARPVGETAYGSGTFVPTAGQALVALWLLTSLALAARFGLSHLALRRVRSTWRHARLGGVEVLLSGDLGPAVTGFFRGGILVPNWVLELDEIQQRLIVAHEREHLRAGDHRLSLLALTACVLVPWNLPLWWGLRRLRLALELDCDRRMLRTGADARRYGSLLIEVGERASAAHGLAAAFAERATALERRVRHLLDRVPRYRAARASLFTITAVILVALACGTRASETESAATPGAPQAAKLTGIVYDGESGVPLMGVQVYLVGTGFGAITAENGRFFIVNAAPGTHVLAAEKEGFAAARTTVTLEPDTIHTVEIHLGRTPPGPHFTPFTARPELVNRDAALAAVERHYPDSLEAMGVGGTANVWVFITESGQVETARLQKSSGVEALDEAAMAAAREFQFTAARNRGQPVSVWIAIPITFSAAPRAAEAGKQELLIALRMIATTQEARYAQTGGYYLTLADTLRSFLPQGTEVVAFQAEPRGWALVLRRGMHECAMYYGQVAAPTAYALAGRAVCRE